MAENLTRELLFTFLKQHRLGVIATASRDGMPEAALVNFAVTPDLELIFETTSATRKYSNLKNNPRAEMVIGWDANRTLQCRADVDEPDGRGGDRSGMYLLRLSRRWNRTATGPATATSACGRAGFVSAITICPAAYANSNCLRRAARRGKPPSGACLTGCIHAVPDRRVSFAGVPATWRSGPRASGKAETQNPGKVPHGGSSISGIAV